MKFSGGLFALVAVLFAVVLPSSASADPVFERAFGGGVITGGDAFEICTPITGCVAGSSSGDAGSLPDPNDIIRDPFGGILVAQTDGNRISRYLQGPSGDLTFDRTFGYGVQNGEAAAFQNCESDCQSGEDTGEAGSLREPWKMAFDAEGRLLVADYGLNRVSRFLLASDGNASIDRTFGWNVNPDVAEGLEACTTNCQPGAESDAAGAFGGPDGIAIDSEGGILVGEYENNRISRFTVSAAGIPQFDRAAGLDVIPGGGTGFENCTTATGCKAGVDDGAAAGAVTNNYDVKIGPDGLVYTADSYNNRVNVFARGAGGNFEFRYAFGADVIPGGSPGFETCTATTGCKSGADTGVAGAMGESVGLVFDSANGLYVSSSGDDRLSRFEQEGAGYTFDYTYGIGVAGGSGPETCTETCVEGTASPAAGGFDSPQGMAFITPRELFVSSYENKRVDVIKVDPVVTVTKSLSPAEDPGRFDLKVGTETVKASAGNGDSGSVRFTAGSAVTVSETATAGTDLSLYDTTIDCGSGSQPGASLTVQNATDNLNCVITNTRKVVPPPPTKANFTKLVLKPKKKKVKAGKKVKLTVKVTNSGGTRGAATVV
ncbi:MAG: NHL repeat-containing protein, partial [Actinomycetota bacterium]|nr:NHL repeat-containing protein [Actinomycetota bacterium]